MSDSFAGAGADARVITQGRHLTNLSSFVATEVAPHPLRLGRRTIAAISPAPVRPVRSSAAADRSTPSAEEVFPPLESVPPPAPIAMPKQDLGRAPAMMARWADHRGLRRAVILSGALAFGGLVGWLLLSALGLEGLTVLEGATVALSVLLSVWVGYGFASALAGFAVVVANWRAVPRVTTRATDERIAILLPAYNEDPGLIFSGVQAMWEDLERAGASDRYDIFVLSDTRESAIARAEAVAFLRLRTRVNGGHQIYYRRRAENIDRKAGNIGEWVERFGSAYEFMLVLDADSLMTAETIIALTAEISADQRAGLVQSVPTIVNARTPFARLQQFASRLYGPVFAAGQQWWSGREGNYWGHNAIIRVAAFAQSAGLPHLKGRKPWGGHIMSHDFIEAALLRRRGWIVRTVADLGGSYEESPPTLLDTAVRDRRWCQGNLQHARLLWTAGLHWVSRLHLVLGISAYLTSPLWLILLVCGSIVWSREHFASGSAQAMQVIWAFGLTMALLAIPKLLALALALASPGRCKGFGGSVRLIAGVVLETLGSVLLTPVTMVMQAVSVFDVLVGRDSGWKPQRREGAEISSKEAWRAHRVHVALGLAGAVGAFLTDRSLLVWAGPVFLSLALSAALSFHTSRQRGAGAPAIPGVLRIPEDAAPPWVLTRARELRAAYAAEAPMRRQIEVLFRLEPAVYEIRAEAHAAVRRLAA
ncbi:MAG: glucans biosynthesis glucosyltransferase MdoH [Caulobacteraceae bacterium]|nr:glucans biosynthesis glucosyltransferase MdoH [Caulobacteraceae bacterium]